jgi:hypothetical protein
LHHADTESSSHIKPQVNPVKIVVPNVASTWSTSVADGSVLAAANGISITRDATIRPNGPTSAQKKPRYRATLAPEVLAAARETGETFPVLSQQPGIACSLSVDVADTGRAIQDAF